MSDLATDCPGCGHPAHGGKPHCGVSHKCEERVSGVVAGCARASRQAVCLCNDRWLAERTEKAAQGRSQVHGLDRVPA